jgi:eukaryotic-like serine/threonine-protein kinase
MPQEQLERLNIALAGRYAVERELGSGGMATVYLAEDLKHHRRVAVKVLRPHLAAALGPERFLREIRIAAHLNHPHILGLHDSGDAAGMLFYVMPYAQGESLRQALEREHQLPVENVLRITTQVAAALQYAHGRGVIHRDIKPENILLYEGEAVLADFGIALAASAAVEERLTGTGVPLGTPEYMSPEQAAGEPELDARSDVYSLACVVYEMLAGEPPYTGRTAHAVLAKQLTDPVPSVRRLRPTVPAVMERALMRALSSTPGDRFPSPDAFVEALTTPDTSAGRRSVAVLPFLNLSADPENEYFADGITEDVIAHLSKVRTLDVISRTSVMPYKKREQSLREIGAELGVGTVLEGSVRRAGNRVRIVAQLLDAETDQHLWAETYDRELTDIFAIQTDVALHIAAALRATLSREEQTRIEKGPTRNVEAYQLYLQGRQCFLRFTDEGMLKAISFFEQAIHKDPSYALALVSLAMCHLEMGGTEGGATDRGTPEQHYIAARTALDRALALDAGLGEAHSILALLKFGWEFDWSGAEREFQVALELNPGNADAYGFYGRMLSAMERYDEAVAMLRKARELDPIAYRSDLISTLIRAGRLEEATPLARALVAFDPESPRAHSTLGWALLKGGLHEEGIAELEKAVALPTAGTLFLGQLGEGYAAVGREQEARAVLRRLQELSQKQPVEPYHLAYVYTGLGEYDAAMDRLDQAYDERSGMIHGIKGSFLFTALHGHPRFEALMRKMNLA